MKSRLVTQNAQGHLQGAIATIQVLCSGIGPAFWGCLFINWNCHPFHDWMHKTFGHPYFTHYGKAFVFWTAAMCSLPSLWLIGKLPTVIIPVHGSELHREDLPTVPSLKGLSRRVRHSSR